MGMMGDDNTIASGSSRNYSFYQGNIVLPCVQSLPNTQKSSESRHSTVKKDDHIDPTMDNKVEREKWRIDKSSASGHARREENVLTPESNLPRSKKKKVRIDNKIKPCEDLHIPNDNLFLPQKIQGRGKILKHPENASGCGSSSTNVTPFSIATQINTKSNSQMSKNLVQSAEKDQHSSDNELIDLYKNYLDKDGNLDDSESDISVSSLSESDDSADNEAEDISIAGTLEPFNSLSQHTREKPHVRDLTNMFNKVVISNSKTSGNHDSSIELYQTGSLPELRSLDTCQIRKVTHVTKNDSEAESEPGAKIRYKVRPLPPIPCTEEVNVFETADDRNVKGNAVSSSPVKKAAKEIGTLLTSIPLVPTNQVRGRKDDHQLADILKYLPDRKLKVFIGTWNMKGTKYLPESLDDFLLPPESLYLQDVYVIGTQEGTPFRHEWQLKLQETFGPSHVLVKASNFGVLQLSVFVRRELVWFCSNVDEDTFATRVGHKIKTKGALAMSFSIFGTSFLFINSHFTSNEGKLQERINDYHSICQNLHFSAEGPSSENSTSLVYDRNRNVTDHFARVFWFGDFNFRVQKSRKGVDKVIRKNLNDEKTIINELLAHDQLNEVRGEIFHGFSEALIQFMPTYKFDTNTDNYDTSSKQRVPSWTDRVLYKSKLKDDLISLSYNSCNTIKNSDHRPVYAIFETIIEPYKTKFVVSGAQFDRDVYVEANMRRAAPLGSQDQSHVCTIL